MSEELELVRAVLAEGDHRVFELDGAGALAVSGVGARGDLEVEAHLRVSDQQIVVYAKRRSPVASDVRYAMSELFTRANWLLPVGNLDLDLDDGEIRAKVGLDFEGDALRPPVLRQMLRTAIALIDTFAPAIDRVAAGESDVRTILLELAGAD